MASPFRESIEKLLNGIEGAVSCALMGFDGITVDISSKEAAAGGPDIQTARRTLESVDAGALEEFTLRTDKMTLVVRLLTPEYFLACAILPTGNLGKARYLMRLSAPALRADL